MKNYFLMLMFATAFAFHSCEKKTSCENNGVYNDGMNICECSYENYGVYCSLCSRDWYMANYSGTKSEAPDFSVKNDLFKLTKDENNSNGFWINDIFYCELSPNGDAIIPKQNHPKFGIINGKIRMSPVGEYKQFFLNIFTDNGEIIMSIEANSL